MALAYSSNSPQYLEYVASTMTREQIMDDPTNCFLLEDPYIKDNMELAIRAYEARHGGHEEKKEFIQYFLCNGPELEVQTILFYREEILSNPEYMDIYNTYFTDISTIRDIRFYSYGKETSSQNGNCFTDPCNYLGPFSDVIGIIGDTRVYQSSRNVVAQKVKSMSQKSDDDEDDDDETHVYGSVRPSSTGYIPKKTLEELSKLNLLSVMNSVEFFKAASKGTIEHCLMSGDDHAIEDAAKIEDAVTLKTYSTLGDCARLFAHARGYVGSRKDMNKQIALSTPLKYKWPYGSIQTVANPTTSEFASPQFANLPENGITALNGKFIAEDKDMIFKWGVSGSLLVKIMDEEDLTTSDFIFNPVSPSTSPERNDGRPGGATTPAKVSTVMGYTVPSSPDAFGKDDGSSVSKDGDDNYMVGCYVDLSNVREYFTYYYPGIPQSAIDELYKYGYISAKIRFGISETGTDEKVQAIVMALPVLGGLSVISRDGAAAVDIDPAIVAARLLGSNVALVDAEATDEIIAPNGGIRFQGALSVNSDGDLSVSSYGKSNIKKDANGRFSVRGGRKYALANGTKMDDCRIRFFINEESDAVKTILSNAGVDPEVYSRGTMAAQFAKLSAPTFFSGGDSVTEVIMSITSLLETGKALTVKSFGDVTFNSGEDYISYGFMNTTGAYTDEGKRYEGNLKKLLNDFYLPKTVGRETAASATIASAMKSYKSWAMSGRNDAAYGSIYQALRAAGTEEAMQRAQREFFDRVYLGPARTIASKNGFQFPLTLLYIAYSKNHGNAEKTCEIANQKVGITREYSIAKEQEWCHVFPSAREQTLRGLKNGRSWGLHGKGWSTTIRFFETISRNYGLTGNIVVTPKRTTIQGVDQPNPGQPA